MLTSAAFTSLKTRQKVLYLYCKAQYYGKRKPRRDYPDIEEIRGDDCFYLSWAVVKQYELYQESMHSNFYKDMQVLIEHGFIERVSAGKYKKKSIYRYSSGWKEWTGT